MLQNCPGPENVATWVILAQLSLRAVLFVWARAKRAPGWRGAKRRRKVVGAPDDQRCDRKACQQLSGRRFAQSHHGACCARAQTKSTDPGESRAKIVQVATLDPRSGQFRRPTKHYVDLVISDTTYNLPCGTQFRTEESSLQKRLPYGRLFRTEK